MSNHSIIRYYYTCIYLWFKKYGRTVVDKVESQRLSEGLGYSVKAKEYIEEIENLPAPSIATIEDIDRVCKLIRYGLFEISYTKKYITNFSLGEISVFVTGLIEQEFFPNIQKSVLNSIIFRPLSKTIPSVENYYEEADKVYNDFISLNERNLGGKIAMIDTNLEYQKQVSITDRYTFRDLRSMNFEISLDSENLFEKASHNAISITSISIK
jgi:hypothetical protein